MYQAAQTNGRCPRPIPPLALADYRVAMPHDHDSGYKRLFAAPEMMRDLLLGFVGHDWVRSADFASLCRVNGSYVSDDLRARHDDMVWKIRLRDEWFYIYPSAARVPVRP